MFDLGRSRAVCKLTALMCRSRIERNVAALRTSGLCLYKKDFLRDSIPKSITTSGLNLVSVTHCPVLMAHVNILRSIRKMCSINQTRTIEQADGQVLYVCDKKRFLILLNLFAISQFLFWTYQAWCLKDLTDNSVGKDPEEKRKLRWYQRVNLSQYKIPLMISSCVLGGGIALMVWSYCFRLVHNIVLHQGNKLVSFSTYTPILKKRIITVPLEQVSSLSHRDGKLNTYLPIKIKSHFFYYIVDTEGNFIRPSLYDKTVGLRRFSAEK